MRRGSVQGLTEQPRCLTDRPSSPYHLTDRPDGLFARPRSSHRRVGTMGADALSDVLRAVRLTGAVFFNLDVKAPWVAETPPVAQCAPFVMPNAGFLIEYHVVTRGSCWAGLVDGEPVQLRTGDIIVFPQGDAHV